MFNTYARGEQQAALPAGIDELTLGKVRALFAEPAARHTAESVAQKMGLSRTTAPRSFTARSAAHSGSTAPANRINGYLIALARLRVTALLFMRRSASW